jgi:hypothetical protein
VKKEEMEEREAIDRRRQARKSAEIQKQVSLHVAAESFDHTTSDTTASTATLSNPAAEGIAYAERTVVNTVPSLHEIEVREAAKVEEQRQAFFEKQVAALKKADLKVRQTRLSHVDDHVVPPKEMEHLSLYEKDEEEPMLDSKTHAHAKAAPARLVAPTVEAEEEDAYKSLGLAPEGKLASVMSDPYRADVTLASVEDSERQHALEAHINQERAREAEKASLLQKAANTKAEDALAAQNARAGYGPVPDYLTLLNPQVVPLVDPAEKERKAAAVKAAAAALYHDSFR